VRDGDQIRIEIDRIGLTGSVDMVGTASQAVSAEKGSRILAERSPHPELRPDVDLPDDTRLWAALQQAGGGTWGGCVYDVDQIIARLERRPG
jgi:dihydroxyacid dehydratase/phosphogluconate dehydratase